jgi:hypothetical protein
MTANEMRIEIVVSVDLTNRGVRLKRGIPQRDNAKRDSVKQKKLQILRDNSRKTRVTYGRIALISIVAVKILNVDLVVNLKSIIKIDKNKRLP